MLQLPAATLALQLCVPSLTVTVPVGVPLPGAVAVTAKVKSTAWPTVDGFGVCPVIAVVVAAGFTVWPTPVEVLAAEVPLPAYVATRVLAPAVVSVTVQVPAATVPLQACVPSLTVTVPVGVPLPGAAAVTAKVKSTAWPTVDGFGVCPVIAVVVPAAFTVWLAPDDVLVAKLGLPS